MKPLHCTNGTFYEYSIVKDIYSVVEVALGELIHRENSRTAEQLQFFLTNLNEATALHTCNSMSTVVLKNNVLLLKLKNSYRKTNK